MRCLSALIALLFCAAQPRDEAADWVRRLQEQAPKAGSAWRTRTRARKRDFFLEKGYEIRSRVLPGEGVRVEFNILDCPLISSKKPVLSKFNRMTLVFLKDRHELSFSVTPLEAGARFAGLPHLRVRSGMKDESHRTLDPRAVSRVFPAFLYLEDLIASYQAAPAIMLGHEPDLRVRESDDETVVLESTYDARPILDRVPDSWYWAERVTKRFRINVARSRIEEIEFEMSGLDDQGRREKQTYHWSASRWRGSMPERTDLRTESWIDGELSRSSDYVLASEHRPSRSSVLDWSEDGPLAADLSLVLPKKPTTAADWVQRAFHFAAWRWVPRAVNPPKVDLLKEIRVSLLQARKQRPGSWLLDLNLRALGETLPEPKGEPLNPALAVTLATKLNTGLRNAEAARLLARSGPTEDADLRIRLLLEWLRAAPGEETLDRIARECGDVETTMHFLRHFSESEFAAARKAPVNKAWLRDRAGKSLLHALIQYGRSSTDRRIKQATAILKTWGDHPLIVQWISSLCWSILGGGYEDSFPSFARPELGAVSENERPMPALFRREQKRLANLRALLEIAAASKHGSARELFLLGLVRYRLKDENSVEAFRLALKSAEREKYDPNPVRIRAVNHVLGELSRVARAMGRTDLLRDTSALFLDLKFCCNPGLGYEHDSSVNPAALYVERLLRKKAFDETYRILVRAGRTHLTPTGSFRSALFPALPAAALVDRVLPRLKTLDEYLALEEVLVYHYRDHRQAVRVLDAARPLAAEDSEVLFRLARYQGRARDWKAAASAARAAVRAAKDPEAPGLYLARLLILLDRADEARKVLVGLEKEGYRSRLNHFGEVYEWLGDLDDALRCQEESIRRHEESAPRFTMGRLHFRKGNLEEALRWFNRDIAHGSLGLSWPETESLPPPCFPDGVPETAAEGRSMILEKLGSTYFIDRLVNQKSPDADESVPALIRAWEKGGEIERITVAREIRALKPTAARSLRDVMLATEDARLRQVLFEILSSWSEPN